MPAFSVAKFWNPHVASARVLTGGFVCDLAPGAEGPTPGLGVAPGVPLAAPTLCAGVWGLHE